MPADCKGWKQNQVFLCSLVDALIFIIIIIIIIYFFYFLCTGLGKKIPQVQVKSNSL